jgi:hypothetical protein
MNIGANKNYAQLRPGTKMRFDEVLRLDYFPPAAMNSRRHAAFNKEIACGKARIAAGELESPFQQLARAHALGQTFVGAHARTHWLMLTLEVRRRRVTAAFEQVIRLALDIIGSPVGVVPIGNTGGSDISIF